MQENSRNIGCLLMKRNGRSYDETKGKTKGLGCCSRAVNSHP